MKGIGIDTGGTCTDAVIYDMEERKILASTKTLTTKRDLKIGIRRALEALPEELLADCGQIALSTTLATNACVENLGGKGKLVLIGVVPKVFLRTYQNYGFESAEDVMILPCHIVPDETKCTQPDWEAFEERLPGILKKCDCISVVQMYSVEHLGAYEKKAAKIIRKYTDVPLILGCTLFSDRNAIQRGAGALLNARLVPVVTDFMKAIEDVFSSLGLDLPTGIIRSDGSQMSKQFALERPVETLLCGPAASVIGASALTDEENALIVDIGGTTTDIAVIKNHRPVRSDTGIQVGAWKTFVKGLFIDTFGLGGDTAVHYEFDGPVYLEDYRVVPLCSLAADYPEVLDGLKNLSESERRHPNFIHEYLCLLKDLPNPEDYTGAERNLCLALKEKPLSMEEAAHCMNADVYTMDFSRLEKEGIVIRAGFTPTDIMHIRGDYNAFSREAAEYAANFVSRSSGVGEVGALCEAVYDLVERRLYENLVRILLTTECPELKDQGLDRQMKDLIRYSYELEKGCYEEKTPLFHSIFRFRAKLIGVGAPTHLFLPKVAKLLHTEAVLPEYASVANAVGAIAGQVTATAKVTIKRPPDEPGYQVIAAEVKKNFMDYDEACACARECGRAEVTAKIRRHGVAGEPVIREELIRKEGRMRLGMVWFYDELHFTAEGDFLPGQHGNTGKKKGEGRR